MSERSKKNKKWSRQTYEALSGLGKSSWELMSNEDKLRLREKWQKEKEEGVKPDYRIRQAQHKKLKKIKPMKSDPGAVPEVVKWNKIP